MKAIRFHLSALLGLLLLAACSADQDDQQPSQPGTAQPDTTAQLAPVVALTPPELPGYRFSLPIKVDFREDFDLSKVASYRLKQYKCEDRGDNARVAQAAENEIRNQLHERGIHPAGQADLSISFLVTRDDQLNVIDCNRDIGYQGYHCVHCDLNRMPAGYEGGTLVIQMIDNSSQRLVWRGIGTANLDEVTPEQELTLVREYVKEMFAAPPLQDLNNVPFAFTLPIRVDHMRGFDFALPDSFELINYEKKPHEKTARVAQAAKNEIRNQLMSKGLKPSDNPDVSFYFIVYRDDLDPANTVGKDIGYLGYRCVHCDLNQMPVGYEGGTLIIQMIDNRTKRLAWRGIGTANLDNVSPEQELTLVRKYVDEMFSAAPWNER